MKWSDWLHKCLKGVHVYSNKLLKCLKDECKECYIPVVLSTTSSNIILSLLSWKELHKLCKVPCFVPFLSKKFLLLLFMHRLQWYTERNLETWSSKTHSLGTCLLILVIFLINRDLFPHNLENNFNCSKIKRILKFVLKFTKVRK